MLTNAISTELINGLQDILADKLLAVVLYGSVAREENTLDSDVDIAVIIQGNMNENEKDKFISWNADLDIKHNKVFSIVDIEKELMDKWGDVVPFYKNIKTEGIVLWKAA